MADQGAAAAAAVPAVQGGRDGVITDEESHAELPESQEAGDANANDDDESGDEANSNPLAEADAASSAGPGPINDPSLPVSQQQPMLYNEGYSQAPFDPPQYHQPFPLAPFQHPPPPHMQLYDPFAMQAYDDARRQAAAYALSAASTAHAMAQIAQAAANFAAGHGPPPSQTAMMPLMTPWNPYAAMYQPLAPPHGYQGINDYTYGMPEQGTIPSNQQPFSHDDAHGRKRQERPPSDNDSSSIPRVIHHATRRDAHNTRNDHRRRRLSNDAPSSSSEASDYNYDRQTMTGHSSRQRHRKRRTRQHGMTSLLGKTAVAALFEWCSKRRCDPPKLELQDCAEDTAQENSQDPTTTMTIKKDCFTCIAFINGVERGRGSSRTKNAARQTAARRAFQSLVPGAVFDEISGLLVSLPLSSSARHGARNRSASMDEELPNLAKRLAIGRDQETGETDFVGDSKKKRLKSSLQQQQPKRAPGLYPASSTTASEDDGERSTCRSTEAGICSVLLHAMVQIVKMPAPLFIYEIMTPLSIALECDVRKRDIPGLSTVGETRAFICRAKWSLSMPVDDGAMDEIKPVVQELLGRLSAAAEDRVLESCGAGVTKREARHVAAAELLALLFPECETKMEVKAAAEAMRARYAEDKARKHRHFDSHRLESTRGQTQEYDTQSHVLAFAMFQRGDPVLSSALQHELLSLIDCSQESHKKNDITDRRVSLAAALSSQRSSSDISACRSLSRQQQIDLLTEQALHALNERDEEGRTIPELTEDDVGRTILRRALSEDYSRIKKLFASECITSPRSSDLYNTCATSEGYGNDSQQVWSTPSIILLLCRAIAPHEDPPLGCCVLTFGFSMKHGRVLNIAWMASEPHLPKERFVECISDFASIMKCHLEIKLLGSEAVYTSEQAHQIVHSYETLVAATLAPANKCEESRALSKSYSKKTILASTLQSVQEESEQSDSSSEKRPKKQTSKPSKRSRFE